MTLRKILVASLAFALVPCLTQAQSPAEARTAHAFEAAKKAGAPELYAFLKPFPKGSDLHMHLSGAVYAETFLGEAARQGLCVDPVALSFDKPDSKLKPGTCAEGHLLAADIVRNPRTSYQTLYDKLVDAFSMRSFVPYAGWSGHDQFFATFDHFGGLNGFGGEWLDEVATRAAAQDEQYLEIMQTPSFNHVFSAIAKAPWPADVSDENHMAVLAKYREELLANGLRDDVAIDEKEFADAEDSRLSLEHCAGASKTWVSAQWSAPCGIKIHWLYQVLRGFPPAQVFAQALLGFEIASADPDVVGINFVRAEDWRGPMADYHTEMLMLDYLHSVYPKVHISLHAGELAPGMVPPDGLTFHIREAIDLGHAERIGHGIDVLHETGPSALLAQMAKAHIMVEINLTSNDVILGIKGTDHPLHAYMAAHVPWALSTDDEGVSRIDLTHEYVKGVVEQNLSYADLKQSARNSLEYSFLHGESLYTTPGDFAHRKAGCMAPANASAAPAGTCEAFLKANEKAAEQYELERRFVVFEAASH